MILTPSIKSKSLKISNKLFILNRIFATESKMAVINTIIYGTLLTGFLWKVFFEEKCARSNNLIFRNLKESISAGGLSTSYFTLSNQSIVDILNKGNYDNIKITRLGKKMLNNDRLLRMNLPSSIFALKLLKRKNNYKEPTKNISLKSQELTYFGYSLSSVIDGDF